MAKKKFIVYGLRDIYHQPGTYEFKIVLNPRNFKNCHESSVRIVDSDRKEMKYDVKKWGRKLICQFTIDDTCSDGVALVDIKLADDSCADVQEGRATFWVIK